MIYLAKFLFVMIAMALTDMCWAYYFIKVEERNAPQAGMWAVLLFFSGAAVTTNYIGDHTMLVAAAIGSFVGTYFTIKFKKK
jgi:hypothetical protein